MKRKAQTTIENFLQPKKPKGAPIDLFWVVFPRELVQIIMDYIKPIVCLLMGSGQNSVEYWTPGTGRCSQMTTLPVEAFNKLNSCGLYATQDEKGRLWVKGDSILMMQQATGLWSTVALNFDVSWGGCCSIAGNIVCCGGFGNGYPPRILQHWTYLDDCVSYSMTRGEWQILPSCPVKPLHHSCATLGSSIYLFGGYTLLSHQTSPSYVFHWATKEWTKTTTEGLPNVLQDLTAVADEATQSIYAVGGSSSFRRSTNQCHVLQTGTMQWKKLPSLPSAVSDCAAIIVDETLVVFYETTVQRLHLKTLRWTFSAPLPRPRIGAAAVIM